MKLPRVLGGLIAVGVLAAAIGVWMVRSNDGIAVQTVRVERGPLAVTIAATGRVVSRRRADVAPAAAGLIATVGVKEGGRVREGALLARLDAREAERALAKAEADQDRAREEAAQARRAAARVARLLAVGGESQQAVDEAQGHLRAAEARERVADEEVAVVRLALARLTITAPFAGLITSHKARVGEWAAPGTALFTLVDPHDLEVEVKIDAGDAGEVAAGQEARMSVDAFPGRVWSETVLRLAPAVETSRRDGEPGGPTNAVTVTISLGPTAPLLRIGEQVDAKIRTAFRPDALMVPFGALIVADGLAQLAVAEQGRVRLVPVVTGIEDATHTEIVEGASAGQVVILPEGRTLREGDRVRVREP